MAGFSDRPPVYLSQRSADVVLSEIRPTKLAPEALRSVNVLLDELLWMILSMARSFATDQFKVALSKLLPTSFGKEALLEAEVELRAYWDRTTNGPSRPYAENGQDFPIQPAFELLRLKCESYSTFNDTDDDSGAEKRLEAKVTSSSGFAAHNMQYIAPAALYLTAILEHICEHVLSNTGRVASRDSSRTTATLQDLFLALCEDDSIYGLFKIMRVHNQIELQCNSPINRPGRSKSIHRSTNDTVKGQSHANGSPYGSVSPVNGEATPNVRVSSDSTGSGTAVATVQSSVARSSTEKSKTRKLFGRMSVDKEGSQAGHNSMEAGHKRSASIMSNGKRPSSALDDAPSSAPSEVEFDELMRSGATMKVSLTPDRLRTFEVYSKEKGRGINKVAVSPLANQDLLKKAPLQDSSAINRDAVDPAGHTLKNGVVQPQKHATQEQDEVNSMRSQKQSKAPPVSYEQPAHLRARSTSASQATATSVGNVLGRKASLGTLPIESIYSQSLRGNVASYPHPKASASLSSNTYSGKRVHQSASRDSIDDLLDDVDEDGPPKKPAGRRKAPPVSGVSRQTADLIDFLNSGPPDLPDSMSPMPMPTPTPTSSLDNKMKRGRLRSIVSRLKGGQSMDKLPSQSSFDEPAGKKFPALPPSFVPPPLSAKRSLHSLSSFAQSQVSLAKQPTPPIPPVSIPLSPPLSPSHSFAGTGSPVRPRPSPTTLRKAVPVLMEERIQENGSESPSTPKHHDVSPPTPSKAEHEDSIAIAAPAKTSGEGSMSTADSHKPSDSLHTPPPSYPSIHPPSKQAQRHALSPPSTAKAFAAHAVDLRRLLANATSADECRLLVDMFLAQAGLPMKDADFPPDPQLRPTAQQEFAVVEALLGNSEASAEVVDASIKKHGRAQKRISPPTPQSDEHYSTSAVYRKPVPVDHAAHVVSAEA